MSADVISLEQRRAAWREKMVAEGAVVEIRTVRQAISLVDEWRIQAEKMDALYAFACIRAEMSDALLRDALDRLERLKGEI